MASSPTELDKSLASIRLRFGHPIALSASPDVEMRSLSTQGYGDVLDVVEASYMVQGDPAGRVQPSVWTWLAQGMSAEQASVLHATNYHISHLVEFRAGISVPNSAETDELERALYAAPRVRSVARVGSRPAEATCFEFAAWTYSRVALGHTYMTVAGPEWFVRSPLTLFGSNIERE